MKAVATIFVLMIALIAGPVAASAGSISANVQKPELAGLRWQTKEIKIGISSSLFNQDSTIKRGSDVRGAIDRSIRAWELVTGIRFVTEVVEKQSVSPAGVNGDGLNLITAAGTAENVAMFGKTRDGDAARTRIFYNKRGSITEADIVLNPFEQFSTDGAFGTFDLESVLIHEIGHMLGLGHTFVTGSVMYESKAKNGILGVQMLPPRKLADSDIAAIRSLYEFVPDVADCCAAVKGKLIGQDGKPRSGMQIWAEDRDTGRLAGYAYSLTDGSFRIGGLPIGDYDILVRSGDADSVSATPMHDLLATVELNNDEIILPEHRATTARSSVYVTHIGLAGQLADSPVVLTQGGEYSLLIGGRSLDELSVLGFSSPLLKIDGTPRVREDLSGKVSVIAINVKVDESIAPGTYSLYVADLNGESAFLGSVVIE